LIQKYNKRWYIYLLL